MARKRNILAVATSVATVFGSLVIASPAHATSKVRSSSAVLRLAPQVQSELATATRSMKPADAAVFRAAVMDAQQQIVRETSAEREAKIATAIAYGYSRAQAVAIERDPVLSVSVPTSAVTRPATRPDDRVRPAADLFAWGGPGPIHCAHSCRIYNGSTAPALATDFTAILGHRLASASFQRKWQYNGWGVTSAPLYTPPTFSTTAFCIGCELNTTFHAEGFYVFADGYGTHLHGGYQSIVYFTVKQCIGLGPISQCNSQYRQWKLKLHYDGGFLYDYNYKS